LDASNREWNKKDTTLDASLISLLKVNGLKTRRFVLLLLVFILLLVCMIFFLKIIVSSI